MNKLFLIGNGFDLAHGLKTRYTDFIVWYLNKVFSKFIPAFKYEDELMKMSRQFHIGPVSVFESIQEFKDVMNNYRMDYSFKHPFIETLINGAHEYNWVDIEAEYYEHLKNLYIDIEKGYRNKKHTIDNEVKNLNNCLDTIKRELIEYLQTIQTEKKKLDTNIASHLLDEIEKFKKENNSKNLKTSGILVLNFNYTSTIENYINSDSMVLENQSNKNGNSKIKFEINYIHGNLKDIEKNPIIFGYGDEIDSYYKKIELLNENELLKHIKSFRYMKVSNYRNLLRFIDSSKFDVFIMGHSCGLSDRVLLNSVFENDNCNSIKIFYHQISQNENDFFEKTQEISRHFSAKGKEKMRTIIIPERECNPLN